MYERTIGSHGIRYQLNGNNEWWWLLLLLGATGATAGRRRHHRLCGPIHASLDTAAVVMVHPTTTTNVEVVAVVAEQ
jgi:MYXO-CTERM domain-containing protein